MTYVGALLTIKPNADDDAAAAVTEKIEAIGTVSYYDESKAKIDEAREAFNALTEDQQALVPAAAKQALTDAEDTYASLKAQAEKEEADRAAAQAAEALIEAIGTVKYDDASKKKIDAARKAYDALTEKQKALLDPAKVKALINAEKAYASMWSSDVNNRPHGEHCFCYDYQGDDLMVNVFRFLCAFYCFMMIMRAALNV